MIKILRTIAELRAWRKALPPNASIGLVPTMGALHAGHISLVDLSRERCDLTIASIFVNPLQFGPHEDLAKYPRPLEHDLALLDGAGVDALFLPSVAELTPEGASTYVVEESVSLPLCGAFRPGHFRGVATIVLKLLNLVQPTHAFFGQKDAQQCVVIERMVGDLNVPVEIVRGAIIREPDGLALSSRNVYLTPAERALAPLIRQSIEIATGAYRSGERDVGRLVALGRARLAAEPAFSVQYWEIRDPETLEPIDKIGERGALVAVAAFLGRTRLIDNGILQLSRPEPMARERRGSPAAQR